ncbi:MAG: protease modulator HflK [Kiritimatiellae bacterium]|nr:protease modulator HflK [Kiritimatiellia bacterium]
MNETDSTQTIGQKALAQALEQSFRLLRWVLFALVVAYLGSGFFIVRQQEKAMVLVLGKARGMAGNQILEPGFHWTWPTPFSEILRFPAERIRDLGTDTFWYQRTGIDTNLMAIDERQPLVPGRDGYSVSADANIFHSAWTLRYRVQDLKAYALSHIDPDALLRRELDRAIVRASAATRIDDALRTKMDEFRATVEAELRARLPQLNLGITVEGVDLTATIPPRQVLLAFNDVIDAEQDQSQQISEARAYATRARNEAAGDADRLRAEGQAEKERMLNELNADANTFTRIRESISGDPVTILGILREDAIQAALQQAEQRYLIPADPGGRRELRIQIGKPKATPSSPSGYSGH